MPKRPSIKSKPTNGTQATYEAVPVADIRIPEKHRQRDQAKVESLGKSIDEIGLLEPIGLTADRLLVYGAHRVAAFRFLGRETIPAMIHEFDDLQRELATIDENIQRHQLSRVERAQALARRKEIYLALHPETRPVRERGGPGRGRKTCDNSSFVSFTKDTAAKIGTSSRTVERLVKVGSNLDKQAAETLNGTPTANKQGELEKLAEQEPETQREIARKIADGTVQTVEEAIEEPASDPRINAAKRGLYALATVSNSLEACGLLGDYEDAISDIKSTLERCADPPAADSRTQADEEVTEWRV